jgi:hypothetical protein
MNCQIQAETKLISSRTTEIEMGPISDPADDVNEAEDDRDSASSVMNNGGSDSVWRDLVQFFKDFRIRGDQHTLDPFQREVQQTSYWTRFAQLFRNRRTRRATVAAAVVMTAQQLCGVSVLSSLSLLFNCCIEENSISLESRLQLPTFFSKTRSIHIWVKTG